MKAAEYDDVDTTVHVLREAASGYCAACGDRRTEGRASDSIDTVRWPGWLA